ncbi:lantibiotic dehydratase [Nocardiopsis sediminis]|uniref:Lantibiotic dehydratase n=1 Tax=Nocardiopsis sediminis TaxID=1778267 RepID=A0ABV8FMD9_9ACTN
MNRDQAAYQPHGIFLLRAPALPTRPLLELLRSLPARQPEAGDAGHWADGYTEGLLKLWARPEVAAAIRSVSPDLAAAVDRLDDLSARDRRRAAMSLGRYLNRMSVRATPLDLVAGVAGGAFGDAAPVRLAATAIGHARARPDMGWAMHLSQALARDTAHPADLRVRLNDLLYEARGRVWLATADGYGTTESRTSRARNGRPLLAREHRAVSIRLTGPVRTVLDHARTPATLSDLRAHLRAAYPDVAAERVDALLRNMLDLDILLTAARPGILTGGDAPSLPEAGRPETAAVLASVATAIGDFNAGRLGPDEVRAGVEAPARAAAPGYDGPVLQIDAALDTAAPPVLPPETARLAQDAVAALARVTADAYPVALSEYADAFTERYGHRARVPVAEVLSEESGLGPPPGYLQPQRSYPLRVRAVEPPSAAARDAVLGRLVSTALARRSRGVHLEDARLTELAAASAGGDDTRPSLPTLDLCLQFSPPGPGRDRWRAVVTGTGVARGGRTFGRFHDLLDPATQASLRDLAAAEERAEPDAITVELTYLPAEARAANVSTRPALHDWELPVNVAPSRPRERVIALSDVLLEVAGGRLRLRSRTHGRPLNVVQGSLLSPGRAPNICRFLLQVSAARTRPVAAFDWGGLADTMPFLPRVERGDVVLRRARWRLREADLAAGAAEDPLRFAEAVRAWAETWMAPEALYCVQSDNAILLDLASAPSLAELRSELRRSPDSGVLLEEALPGPEDGFLRDAAGEPYVAEVVVPFVSTAATATRVPAAAPADAAAGAPAAGASRPRDRVLPTGDRALPTGERVGPVGGDWVFAKLYAEPEAHDALLTEDLAALTAALRERRGVAGPFFIRYIDSAPHLRVRFRVPDAALRREVLGDVAEWAHGLTAQGKVTDAAFASYLREVDRYGGPGLIGDAEEWFRQDSAAATLLLRGLRAEPGADRTGMAAVGLERLGRALLPDPEERRRLARSAVRTEAGGDAYRSAKRALWADLTGTGGGAPILDAAEAIWRPAAERFMGRLGELERSGELWSGRTEIVRSLLHMHCNRMGLSRTEEEAAHGMWRRLLDRIAHTPGSDGAGPR